MLVSIVITNFNYNRYLRAAIESALNQDYAAVEVIVVDDGSVDGSPQTIAGYGERIIPVLKSNSGQASAFNAGFGTSSGDVVCFLDSDDVFLPQKAGEVAKIFSSDARPGWFFHRLAMVDTDSMHGALAPGPRALHTLPRGRPEDYRAQTRRGHPPSIPTATSGLCFRRSVLGQILPMPEASGVSISDNYLKRVAVALACGYISGAELAIQRLHGENIFTNRANAILGGEIEMRTAYHMLQRYPDLYRLTDNCFSRGMGLYHSAVDGDTEDGLIATYLALTGIARASKIRLKASRGAMRLRRLATRARESRAAHVAIAPHSGTE